LNFNSSFLWIELKLPSLGAFHLVTHTLSLEPVRQNFWRYPSLLTDLPRPWFSYEIHVHPHHTDYAGVVWHGTYLTWLEEARIEYLRAAGANYADLVAAGCILPVVELALRYYQPLSLGMTALMKARLSGFKGVRLMWDYRIESLDGQQLYTTAQVTLVPVSQASGKIMRKLPLGLPLLLST
jgi:acyl-CoA thioester hydrolase